MNPSWFEIWFCVVGGTLSLSWIWRCYIQATKKDLQDMQVRIEEHAEWMRQFGERNARFWETYHRMCERTERNLERRHCKADWRQEGF